MSLIKTEDLLVDNLPEFYTPGNTEVFYVDQLQPAVNKVINYISSYTGSGLTFGVIASDVTLMMVNISALFQCDIRNVNGCYFSPFLKPGEYFETAIDVLIIEAGLDFDNSFFENRGISLIELSEKEILGGTDFEYIKKQSAVHSLIKNKPFHISKTQVSDYADWFQKELGELRQTAVGINFSASLNNNIKNAVPFLQAGANMVVLDFEDGLDNVCANIEGHQIKTLFLSAVVVKKLVRFLEDRGSILDIENIIIGYDTQNPVNKEDLNTLYQYCPNFKQVICLFGYLTDGLPQCYRSITDKTNDFSANTIGKSIFAGRNFVMDSRMKFLPADVVGKLFVQADHEGNLIKQNDSITRVTLSNRDFELLDTGYKARYNADKVIQILEFDADEFFADGARINIPALELSIINATDIDDCKIIRKRVGEKETVICFYVAEAAITSTQLYDKLSSAFADELVSGFEFVQLPNLPLNADGEVNTDALKRIHIIERSLKNAVDDALLHEKDIDDFVTLSVVNNADEYLFSADALSAVLTVSGDYKSGMDNRADNYESIKTDKSAFINGGDLVIETSANQSLITLLQKAIAQNPGNGIAYYATDGKDQFETYDEVFNKSKRILTGLQNAGLKRGDKVILQISENREFFPVFWACIAGGIIPLAVGPITFYTKENSSANRLYNAWQLLDKPAIIASDSLQPLLVQMKDSFALDGFNIIPPDQNAANEPAAVVEDLNNDTAFMLLTSGSTGLPKCIPISHKSAVAHILGMKQHLNFSADDVIVNILPIDHITPILTLHIRGMVIGANQVHIDTPDFINDPLVWLDAIEKHKATHTFSPNFAYKLVLDGLAASTGRYWDLSSVKYFKNGGELVNYDVGHSFIEKLRPFDIGESNFQPAYGMTEGAGAITAVTGFNDDLVYHIKKGTLTKTLLKTTAHDPERVTFMSVGKPIPGVSVRVVNAENQVVTESEIGEIQACGDVVTKGYINNQKANQAAFDGEWFKTGDFGFIKDGNLVVTGRVKDVIIINGINYYAYEFEQIIKSIQLIEADTIAVLGVQDKEKGTESLAVFFVAQTQNFEKIREICKKIRTTIVSYFGVEPAFVIPLDKDKFPRTESGKINKTALLAGLLAGDFKGTINKLQNEAGGDAAGVKLFQQQWVKKNIRQNHNSKTSGKMLVFCNDKKLLGQLINSIGEAKVIEIVSGSVYRQIGIHKFEIDPLNKRHYQLLIAALSGSNKPISNVLFALSWAVGNDADDGPQSLQFLISALSAIENEVDLTVLSHASGKESGIVDSPKGLPGVFDADRNINIKYVDNIAANFYSELHSDKNEQVAYKDGGRCVSRLKLIDPAAIEPGPGQLKKNGIYIIFTGSDDTVPNALCELLQTELKAKAVLLIGSNTQLPYLQVCIKTNKDDLQVDNCYLENLDILIKEIEQIYHTELSGVFFIDTDTPLADENEDEVDPACTLNNLKFSLAVVDTVLAKRDNVFCAMASHIVDYNGKHPAIPYAGDLLNAYCAVKKGNGHRATHITLISAKNDVQTIAQLAAAVLISLVAGPDMVACTEKAAILLKKYTENNYKDEQYHIYYTSANPVAGLAGLAKKFPALKNQLFALQVGATPLKGQQFDDFRLLNNTVKINELDGVKNDIEKTLIGILESVLNKKDIHLTDNFFELGGNSLKAIQIISRIYKELGAVIEFKDIFKNPKIADLAFVIANSYSDLYQSIKPAAPQAFYELSHAQKRLWVLDEQEENHIAYNMPMGYFLNGKLDVKLLEKTFETLIQRHEILRTVFITIKGEPRQKVNPGINKFKLRYLDLRTETDKDSLISSLAEDEFACSFNLETGPLLRATVIHTEPERYLLLFTMHHIISDGWSLQVIFNELIVIYNALLNKEQPLLPELKIHYKDYSTWYNNLLMSDEILIHKNYWIRKLGSKTFEAVIPADINGVQQRNYDGNTKTFLLGADVIERLKLFTGKHEVTTFIVVQAVVKLLLSKYSGQKDVTIGAPMAGRAHKELEGQIGFYLNNLVLTDQVENNDSFLTFLAEVKQTNLDAFIHQLYPYDRLVEDMDIKLAKGRNPFYDVMIVMQTDGVLIGEESAAGHSFIDIKVEPFTIDYTISKLDLTFFFKLEDDFSFDIEYRSDLFYAGTIDKIAADFKTILLKIMEQPDINIEKLKQTLITSEQKEEHFAFTDVLAESLTEDF